MLELGDIQPFLVERPPGRAARYDFLSFARPDAGRAWLASMLAEIGARSDMRWLAVAFTWQGLRALEERQVHCIPEAFLGRPGPRLVQGLAALRTVVEACAR